MPSDSQSGLSEKILLAVWKLKGVGSRYVKEKELKAELPDVGEGFSRELQTLQDRGFIVKSNSDRDTEFALTPIGVAILRQMEEDKLQELG